MQFVERAPNGLSRIIAQTSRSRGRIIFRPLPGARGLRQIEGSVEVSGSVRETKTVATFRERRAIRPPRPPRVVLRRRGPTMAVSWLGVRGVAGYVVYVRLRDGRRFEQSVLSGRRRVLLSGVDRRTSAQVTLRSFTRSGIHSRATRRSLRRG